MSDRDPSPWAREQLADKWVVLYRGLFWGPDRGGYTSSLLTAGLYSEAEAKQIEQGSDRGDRAVSALGEWQQTRDVYYRKGTVSEALFRALDAARAAEQTVRDALLEYANPLNWGVDEQGIRRVWMEPGSSSPTAYNGFELAAAALRTRGEEDR
jgi:hypothetical protein